MDVFRLQSRFLVKLHLYVERSRKVGFSEILTDKFKRFHDYLRISLTEKCNLRCAYCMPENGVELSPKANLLTKDEIVTISRIFVDLGVKSIRFTGGEPLIRRDLVEIISEVNKLRNCSNLQNILMTTNGVTLSHKLDRLIDAGLTGVNISLDTLNPDKFSLITRRNGFSKVWRSIMNAIESNLDSVKINCVVMKGFNDDEIVDFVRLTQKYPIQVRFIEYMPFGGNQWSLGKMLSYGEMRRIINDAGIDLIPTRTEMSSTAKIFTADWSNTVEGLTEVRGKVGFITSNTLNFCATCNRLRITANGQLKPCLHDAYEIDLLSILRQHNNEPGVMIDQLHSSISLALSNKLEQHSDMKILANQPNRPMILIGG